MWCYYRPFPRSHSIVEVFFLERYLKARRFETKKMLFAAVIPFPYVIQRQQQQTGKPNSSLFSGGY